MVDMFYTYVLESLKDHKKYIGSTGDLKSRFERHNQGLVLSTKSRRPFKVIYFEKFDTLSEARWRERSFKRSHDLLNRAMLRAMKYGRRPSPRLRKSRDSERGPLARREGAVG